MDTAIVCKKPSLMKTLLLQLFYWLYPEWFPTRQELERLTKENKTLKGIISQTYQEGLREIKLRSGRILELHRLLTVKEKQVNMANLHATKDPLTWVLNRYGLSIALSRQIGTTKRNLSGMDIPFPNFVIMFIDLDNFKDVNDVYSHKRGDKALIDFVDIARTIFHRDTDMICRYGGDEFVIVAANTSIKVGIARAKMLRAAVANDNRLRFPSFGVTTSIGIATIVLSQSFTQHEIDGAIDKAFKYADGAMYNSKKMGRNKVSVHNETI